MPLFRYFYTMAIVFDSGTNKTFSKGTILLRQGEKCMEAYRVISGCLRSYIVDGNGKEHILQFAPCGWVISDLNSIFNNVPSAVFIDVITDAEVTAIPKSYFDTHVPSYDELKEQNGVFVRNIIAANKRLSLLLSSTAEERYNDFLETYPSLAQVLPLKYIASYIGVTPEYLSDIRHRAAKKK
jgi:CRP-like cAMP-binding protein